MARFVLASASPRRRQLLQAVGIEPEVRPSDVDERLVLGEAPIVYARRVAASKAEACMVDTAALAADTVVAQAGEVFPKTADPDRARQALRRLSGESHFVHTAVALRPAGRGADLRILHVSTEVRFRRLSDADIERYLQTEEPFDKAGSYGIQGAGGALVAAVQGSYTNVVGLPLEETLDLLAAHGLWSFEVTT